MGTVRKRKAAKIARQCLHCSRDARNRGVCRECSKRIRAAIKRKEITDEQAVQVGIWLAINLEGRPMLVTKVDERIAQLRASVAQLPPKRR